MYVLHNKEQKKIVCFAWGEKGRDVSPQGRSNWLFEIKEKSADTARKADRIRMIREGKQSPLKERNERTGAFSPCGYSTFMTRDRNKTSFIHQDCRQCVTPGASTLFRSVGTAHLELASLCSAG